MIMCVLLRHPRECKYKMLPFLTIALLCLSGSTGAREFSERLSFNLCASFNTENFICSTVLGHFCTYCTKPDAPSNASDKHTCVTKNGVKRAIAGEFRSILNSPCWSGNKTLGQWNKCTGLTCSRHIDQDTCDKALMSNVNNDDILCLQMGMTAIKISRLLQHRCTHLLQAAGT